MAPAFALATAWAVFADAVLLRTGMLLDAMKGGDRVGGGKPSMGCNTGGEFACSLGGGSNDFDGGGERGGGGEGGNCGNGGDEGGLGAIKLALRTWYTSHVPQLSMFEVPHSKSLSQ